MGVLPLDEGFELVAFDSPLPTAADLDGWQLPSAHECIDLRHGSAEHFGDVGEREETSGFGAQGHDDKSASAAPGPVVVHSPDAVVACGRGLDGTRILSTMSGMATTAAAAGQSGRAGGLGTVPARRLVSARWRDPRLAVGVVLVAASVVLGVRVVSAADDTVAVWSLRSDLPAGAAVTTADVTVTRLHFGDGNDAALYVSADETLPAGVVLAHDVSAGELLPLSSLRSPTAAAAELPLAVPNGALPSDLGPGDRVDVWVAPDVASTGETGRAVRVLSGVGIVSLDAADTALGGGDATRVLIALDESAASQLDGTLARLAAGTPVLVRLGGG